MINPKYIFKGNLNNRSGGFKILRDFAKNELCSKASALEQKF